MRTVWDRRSRFARLSLALLAVAAIGVWAKQRAISRDLNRARDLHGTAYLGSAACQSCHADRHASWRRTFHRTMTTEASVETVLGDFSGATLRANGVTARMDRAAGGGYRMTFSRPGEAARAAEVVRTVGSHRYQQYLTRVGDSYWRLPVAWSVEERRWFPMTGAFLFADPSHDTATPSDGVPVFGGGGFDRHVTRWNDNCVFCHNVAPDPGRDPASGRFSTTVAELGVACEACHGPGAEHVARNADPLRRLVLSLTDAADPTIVNPARLTPARAADLCGRCHGQRITGDIGPFLQHGDPFVAGDDLAQESTPLWRDTPLRGDRTAFAARFWHDGTPRLTAYEYQGLLRSPCAQKGRGQGPLTCTHCHGMHEGDPRGQIRTPFARAAENQMCTGCHTELAAPEDAGRHAHHDPGGAGGRCVACHMPRIVYGVLDVHRSHRIEIPDPARAAIDGRPDACTGCHVDRSVAWADAAARSFWGAARFPARSVIAEGTAPGEAIFGGEPVARAVAADALGRAPPGDPNERARRLGLLLDAMTADRYPAVRDLAWRGLRRLAAPGAGPGAGLAAEYDPSAEPGERARAVAGLRTVLGSSAVAPPPAAAAALRAKGQDRDLEIGE
jgi:predicted CXXCH cytochrome family protein